MDDVSFKPTFITELLNALSAAWNNAGISYGVVHGLEGYPVRCGRDIDILVEERDGSKAVELTSIVMEQEGWMCSVHRLKVGVTQIFALRKERDRWYALEIDFLIKLRLQWGPVCLVDPQAISQEVLLRDGFFVHPWGSFVKRLLIQALAGNWKRLECRPHEFELSDEERQIVESGLLCFLGRDTAKRVLAAVAGRDVPELQQLMPEVKRRLFQYAARPSMWRKTVETCLRWARGEWVSKIQKNIAPIVAIVGPDGVGKSSMLRDLSLLVKRDMPFPGVLITHWRPNVLPRLGIFFGGTKSQLAGDSLLPLRGNAGKFSFFYKFYYFANYLIGYWIVDRIKSRNLFLTFYEQCFLDMMVDPLRFGLADNIMLERLYRYLPHPDLVVLLQDFPERIHARNTNLSVPEIAQHLNRWKEIQSKGLIDHSVVVSGSSGEAAAIILDHVVEVFQKGIQKNG